MTGKKNYNYPTMRPERMVFLIAAGARANRATWLHGNSGIGKSQLVLASGRATLMRETAWGAWLAANGHSPSDVKAAWEAWEKAYKKARPEYMREDEFPYLEVIQLTIPQHDAEDFTGVPKHKLLGGVEYEEWVTTWAPVEVFRRPVPVILFLDEVSAAESRTQKVLLQLVQERRIANTLLAAGTMVILAGNLDEDRAHLKSVPFTLGNRCAHYILKISVPAWLKWAEKDGVPGIFRAWVQEKEISALWNYKADVPSLAQLTPRSFAGAAISWREAQKMEGCTDQDLEDLISANIGVADAVELLGFMRFRDKVATWDQITSNPHKAMLPAGGDLSMTYYACGMILDHVIDGTCDNQALVNMSIYLERVFKAYPEYIDAAAWMITEVIKLISKGRPTDERNRGMRILDAISCNTDVLAGKASALLASARGRS
jgi:hypothetical protein